MSYVLGLDISTTASKALLLDASATVVASASTPHDSSSPHPLWSEQNPEDWWHGCCVSIRSVLAESGIKSEDVKAVGLTGQMHGLVLLDREKNVLRPAILWNDQRTSAECDQIRETIGRGRLLEITGNDALNGFTAPKLLWVRNQEPDVYGQIEHVLLPKDFIRFKLTGQFATDKAGAGGTLLFDLAEREWSLELIDQLGFERSWFPDSHEGSEVTGEIVESGAPETGLNVGTQVVAGGGDQAAQAFGVGAIDPDTWAITLGTSGVVFVPTSHPGVDPNGRVQAFPHAIPQIWHLMGVMLSAAACLKWYHDSLTINIDYETLLEEAAAVAPGADGLFFQPYLTGERTPHNDPLLRASFVGITSRHSRGHFTRAILEGVAFGIRDNMVLMEELGFEKPGRIRISGGGTAGELWPQIMADVLGIQLEKVVSNEAAAIGSAMLAGVAVGLWASPQKASAAGVVVSEIIQPESGACLQYEPIYQGHRSLYPVLSPLYKP